MPIYAPDNSITVTTAGAAAVEIGLDMAKNRQYQITAKTDAMWVRMVKAGEAVAVAAVGGAGSHYVPLGATLAVAAIGNRNRVSVCRDGATDISAILSEIAPVVGMD